MRLPDTARGHLWSLRALLRPGAPPAVALPARMPWRDGHVRYIAHAPAPGKPWIVGFNGLGAHPGSGLMRRAGAEVVARGWGWLAIGPPWCPRRGILHPYPDPLALADAALDHLGASSSTETARFAILGLSLGGVAALRAAAQGADHPRLRAAVALCPPLDPQAIHAAFAARPTLWPYQRAYLSWLRALDVAAPPPQRPEHTTRALTTARTLADWERAADLSPPPLHTWWPPPTSRPTLTLATRQDPLIDPTTLTRHLDTAPHTLRLRAGGHLAFPGGIEAALTEALDWLHPLR